MLGLAIFTCVVGFVSLALAAWAYYETRQAERTVATTKEIVDRVRAQLRGQLEQEQE